MGTDLGRRIVLGGLALAGVIVAIILLQWDWWRPVFAALVALVAAAAQWEYYRLAGVKGLRPAVWMSIGAGIFFLAVHWFQSMGCLAPGTSALGLGLAGFAVACFFLGRQQAGIAGLATSIFGIVYVIVPFGLFYDILFYYPAHHHTIGWWWFFYVVGVTVLTDAGAYFIGKFFGRHKMTPNLSPGKTWEGTAGGVVVGVAFAIVWWLFGVEQTEFWMAVVLGAIVAIVGQVADLVESLFKRDAEVKDSNVIPALGGVLDVVDSLLFTLPAVYIFMRLTIGA
jgi:phosphatidate cytidylyltransferase